MELKIRIPDPLRPLLWLALAFLPPGVGAQTYQRIFDGVTLKGWHQTGKGNWAVVDSALIGTMALNNPESYLISDITAKDFSLRLKFWWVKGNSGVNFRNVQKGDLSNGIQSDIEGGLTSGDLYDNEKAIYVAKSDSIPKWFKANAWNDLIIDANGSKISVSLNGKQTVTYNDVGGHSEGVFAFQFHVGQEMEVRFKDIEMLDYAKPAAVLPQARPGSRSQGLVLPFDGSIVLPEGSWKIDGTRIPGDAGAR